MSALAASPGSVVTALIDSPLGPLAAGVTDEGVCRLEFTDLRPDRPTDTDGTPGPHLFLDRLRDDLADYFAGQLREFTVPVVCRGTPFQDKVWRELLRIPFGETRSYADIARAIGDANASRAVGSANGRNCVAIIIPCHRVIASGGLIGGYGGGLDRKRFLLDLERHASAR
jgi:O-6-methylguanine DNA methyltransferase